MFVCPRGSKHKGRGGEAKLNVWIKKIEVYQEESWGGGMGWLWAVFLAKSEDLGMQANDHIQCVSDMPFNAGRHMSELYISKIQLAWVYLQPS